MNGEKTNKIMSSEELDDVLPKYEPIKLSGKNLAQNYVSAFNTGMNIYQCVNQLQGSIAETIHGVNKVVESWNDSVDETLNKSIEITQKTATEQFNKKWTAKQPELIEQVNTLTTNQFNKEKSVFNDKLKTLDERMDTFTKLPEGSTTGDAELKDIRVGANGVTYHNAGNAVRGQYSQLKEDITKVGTITECVAIVDGVEMSESVASVEFAFNAFEYRKVVIQIEAKEASADAQILTKCIVNNGKSERELIRVPLGAISKNNRITVIEWYPTSTEGINIQTVSSHVVNTNISVIKSAKLYQSDMSKIVFTSILGDEVIPVGTKFFIWGLR